MVAALADDGHIRNETHVCESAKSILMNPITKFSIEVDFKQYPIITLIIFIDESKILFVYIFTPRNVFASLMKGKKRIRKKLN